MSDKSAFRNWVRDSEELNRPLADFDPINIAPGNPYKTATQNCSFVIIDFLTWLSGINPTEDGLTARILASRLCENIHRVSACQEGRVLVLAVDKSHVTIAKGGTQRKRNDTRNARSVSAVMGEMELNFSLEQRDADRMAQLSQNVRQNIPVGMSFERAVELGIINTQVAEPIIQREQKRTERLAFHQQRVRDLAEQRNENFDRLTLLRSDIPQEALSMKPTEDSHLTMVQRALKAVNDTLLPTPWGDVMSDHRPKLMRWLVRHLMCSPTYNHLSPSRGSVVIIDGHCMCESRAPNATDDQLATAIPSRKKDIPADMQDQFDTPLMFLHPEDAAEMQVDADNWNIPSANSSGSIADVDGAELLDSDFVQSDLSNVTTFDGSDTFLNYVSNMTAPRAVVTPLTFMRNKLGEADMAVFFYALKLLFMYPEKPAVVELVSVDTDIFLLGLWFLYKWENNMFAPEHVTKDKPLPTLLHTSGRGWSAAGTKGGAMNVTAAYKRLIAVHLEGDSSRIPSLIATVVCAGGDYTCARFHEVTMMRFVTAMLNYQTRTVPSQIETRADEQVVVHTSTQRYLADLITHHWDDAHQRYLPKVNGVIFARVVRCAYFDTYRHVFIKRYADIAYPWDLSFDQLRLLINTHVTKSQPHQFVTDASLVMPGVDTHQKLMRALKKRIPPDEQLRVRSLLLLHVMLMYADVGLGSVVRWDLSQLGFGVKDPLMGISRKNIESLATDDWEKRDELFHKVHGSGRATVGAIP